MEQNYDFIISLNVVLYLEKDSIKLTTGKCLKYNLLLVPHLEHYRQIIHICSAQWEDSLLLPEHSKMATATDGTGGDSGKEPACQFRRHKRHRLDPWVGKIPWSRKWQPTPAFLPGESHGQRHLLTKSWTQLKQLSMHAGTEAQARELLRMS